MLTRRSTFPLWFAADSTIRQPVDDGGDNIVTRRLLMHQIVEDVLDPLQGLVTRRGAIVQHFRAGWIRHLVVLSVESDERNLHFMHQCLRAFRTDVILGRDTAPGPRHARRVGQIIHLHLELRMGKLYVFCRLRDRKGRQENGYHRHERKQHLVDAPGCQPVK